MNTDGISMMVRLLTVTSGLIMAGFALMAQAQSYGGSDGAGVLGCTGCSFFRIALAIAAPIGFVYLGYRLFFGTAKRAAKDVQAHGTITDAIGALNKRLANGEIDEGEYRQLRSALERNAR